MGHKGFKTSRIVLVLAGLLLLEFAWTETALALDPERAITQYVHDVWQIEDGLPSNVVNGIVQTRDGYLWLSSDN